MHQLQPHQHLDLDMPLNAQTDDSEAVARIVEGLLGGIEDLKANEGISDRDIVQALNIATAVRTAVADLSADCDQPFSLKLLDIELTNGRLN
jgi:hypothetical protein